MYHPLFHNTLIIGTKAVRNQQYRNNTNLNLQDVQYAADSRSLWNLDLDEDIIEQRRLEERAVRFTAHTNELRSRNLKQILDALASQQTGCVLIDSNAELNTHLKYYEGEAFDSEVGNWLRDKRQHIINYTYSIVKAVVEHNHTSPLALKLIKRFAIRLGLTQYTSHL